MKPILLGMNNPHSHDPSKALGVRPQNASGWRLWQMLSISGMVKDPPVVIDAQAYEAGFDRYNLLDDEVFDPTKFTKERKAQVLDKLNEGVVVMCGTNVPRILGLRHSSFDLKPQPVVLGTRQFVYYVIPHPSGLCREYNDPDMRSRVGSLLLMLYILGGLK